MSRFERALTALAVMMVFGEDLVRVIERAEDSHPVSGFFFVVAGIFLFIVSVCFFVRALYWYVIGPKEE